jgi:hypothetical protein
MHGSYSRLNAQTQPHIQAFAKPKTSHLYRGAFDTGAAIPVLFYDSEKRILDLKQPVFYSVVVALIAKGLLTLFLQQYC